MKNNIFINGELLIDILSGATIEEHHNVGTDWFILAKTGHGYTQYEIGEDLEFKITHKWLLGRPGALKMFRADIRDRVPVLRIVVPSEAWHRGMNKGQWDAIVKENERLKALAENN